jgi:hypothetical protein
MLARHWLLLGHGIRRKHRDAIIIDVRRNVGGILEVSQLLSSYFFDSTPVLLGSLSWRGDPRTEDFYTLRTVGGTRIGARKPLYVLISDRTFSAAEGFADDLQARRRASARAPKSPLTSAGRAVQCCSLARCYCVGATVESLRFPNNPAMNGLAMQS